MSVRRVTEYRKPVVRVGNLNIDLASPLVWPILTVNVGTVLYSLQTRSVMAIPIVLIANGTWLSFLLLAQQADETVIG